MGEQNDIRTPVFLAALGVFLQAALAYTIHLFLYGVFFTECHWLRVHHVALKIVLAVVFFLAFWMLVVGMTWLLRRMFRIWRIGAFAWVLAALMTPIWPLAILLPVARRRGNRPASRLAIGGGVALLLVSAFGVAGRFAEVPVYWPMLLGSMVSVGLVLAALRVLDGSSRSHRVLGWAFAFVVLVSLATQPAFHVGRVRRQADAAFSAMMESIGSKVSPDDKLAGRIPVPEEEDPIAALDENALEADEASFSELRRSYLFFKRRHPLTPEEIAFANDWFATHTNLAAKADFLSASPDYCSCLPCPATFAEAVEQMSFNREPRRMDALSAANLLLFRARVALAAGDGAAGAAAFRRIRNLAALDDKEFTLLNFLISVALHDMSFQLLSSRIDLWNEDDLFAVQRTAEEDMADVGERIREAIAGERLVNDALFDKALPEALEGVSGVLRGSGMLEYWLAAERRAFCRHSRRTWEDIQRLLVDWPSDGSADAEIRRLELEEEKRCETLPPLSMKLAARITDSVVMAIVRARDRVSFVYTVVAVERYRRAHGGEVPPSLDALVPDYLSAVPRYARTGEPMAYEPGPIDIPEEEVPALRDLDEIVAERAKEDHSWVMGLMSEDETQKEEALRRFNEEMLKDKPKPEMRVLPAVTLPGFRLTIPNYSGKSERDTTYDFFVL